MSNFIATNKYTVKRLNNQQIQVFKAKGKSPSRALFMAVGATQTPTCYCPVHGRCGHQQAAEEFAATERQPVAKHTPSRQEILSELYFGWA